MSFSSPIRLSLFCGFVVSRRASFLIHPPIFAAWLVNQVNPSPCLRKTQREKKRRDSRAAYRAGCPDRTALPALVRPRRFPIPTAEIRNVQARAETEKISIGTHVITDRLSILSLRQRLQLLLPYLPLFQGDDVPRHILCVEAGSEFL